MSDDFFNDLSDLASGAEQPAADPLLSGETRVAKLSALVEDMNRDLTVSVILERAMDAAIELTGAERGFLVLVADDGSWTFRVARNMEKEEIADAEHVASRTVIRKVLAERKPVLINDVSGTSDVFRQTSVARMQVRSIMGAPLIVKHKLIGAAYVDTANLAGVFDQTCLVLFETFVQLAAIALENARLIEAERQAAAHEHELKDYLNTILRSLPHGVIILDTYLTIEYVNPQAARLLGNDEIQAGVSLPTMKVRDEGCLLKLLSDLHRFLKDGAPTRALVQDQDRTLAYSFFEFRKAANQPERVGLILEDVSVQKQLERRLVESEKRSTVNQLAGGIAHELNNSLQPVKGHVELLEMRLEREGAAVTDDLGKDLQSMSSLLERMEVIVGNLRHLSKPAEPKTERLDLNRLVTDTVNLLKGTTGKLRRFELDDACVPYRITFALEPNLPPVHGDRHSLESALINLILNSAHAVLAKPAGTVTIRTRIEGDSVSLSVEDDGIGMSDEILAHLFEPYFTTKGQDEGTGLGMCIIQNIAEHHHASLDVQSTPGEGTAITMTFPTLQEV